MPDGLLVVDKPSDWSSHRVVGRLRRLLNTRKIGHAGTLDPMATGVLVLGVGKATRLLGHLALHDKRYLATIRLGASTVTDDAMGDVLTQTDATHLSEDGIRQAVKPFIGQIMQRPASVSAIKVDGQRSYKLVRAGEEVQLAARQVTVTDFTVNQVEVADTFVDVQVDVTCSSGTYIRSLARDLGESLQVGGHLTMLRRVRSGPFTLEGAVSAQQLETGEPGIELPNLGEMVKKLFPYVIVPEDMVWRLLAGQTVPIPITENPTAALTEDGVLLGLYCPAPTNPKNYAKPLAVFRD